MNIQKIARNLAIICLLFICAYTLRDKFKDDENSEKNRKRDEQLMQFIEYRKNKPYRNNTEHSNSSDNSNYSNNPNSTNTSSNSEKIDFALSNFEYDVKNYYKNWNIDENNIKNRNGTTTELLFCYNRYIGNFMSLMTDIEDYERQESLNSSQERTASLLKSKIKDAVTLLTEKKDQTKSDRDFELENP